MSHKVKIRVEIDPYIEIPQVLIKTSEKTETIDKMVATIERCMEEDYPQLIGYSGDSVVMLNQWDVFRVYTSNRKVVLCTAEGEYETKKSLKEIEDILDPDYFTRISRFEIVNLKKVFSFDLSISGTIRITFVNKDETWVARRFVRSIADKLTAKGEGRCE